MRRLSYRVFRNSLRYQLERHLGPEPDIIWLASYPRSGNTFFRSVLKYGFGIPSFDLYHLRKPQSGGDVSEEMGLTDGPIARSPATGRRVYFVKTHEGRPKDEQRAIYLIRDGRDALVSYAYFRLNKKMNLPLEERTPERLVEVLRAILDHDRYGDWSAHIEAWTRRERTCPVRFETLIQSPLETVRAALDATGYGLPETPSGALPTFDELHQQYPKFFRAGRVGGWREELPDDIHRLFWERHGEMMVRLGYTDGMP